MFGYDWPRTHALLTAFPVALLSMAVIFEVLAIVLKKDQLRRTGFALLIVGTLGAGAAVLAGLQAEDAVEHGGAAHELMEHHQQLAYITLGIFAAVTLWRLLREQKMGGGERLAALLLALGGLLSLSYTGHHGGQLVFEHAAGIPDSTLHAIVNARSQGHEHAAGAAHDHGPAPAASAVDSSAGAPPDPAAGARPHTHPPGTEPHQD